MFSSPIHCLRCPRQPSPRVEAVFIILFSCRASSARQCMGEACAMAAAGDASDDGGGGGGDGGFPFRAWNRGWRMAKMMAVAGVAISSATVVVPPIFVASAVGAAFAVPFAVFFAGYAWTERIMGSLIPPPGPPSAALGEEQQAEEEETTAAGGRLEEGDVPALSGTSRWRISTPGEGEEGHIREIAAPAKGDEIWVSPGEKKGADEQEEGRFTPIDIEEESFPPSEPREGEELLREIENEREAEEMKKNAMPVAFAGEEILCAPEVEVKLADVKQMEEAGDRETFMPILRVGREAITVPEGEELLEGTFPPADYSVVAVSTVELSVLIEPSGSSSEPASPSTEERSSYPAEVEAVVSQSRDDKVSISVPPSRLLNLYITLT